MTIDFDAQYDAFKRGDDEPEPAPVAEGVPPEPQAPEPTAPPAPPTPELSQAPSWWDTPVEPLGDPELELPPSLIGKPAREIARMMKGYAHQAHQAGFQKNEVEAENRALKALLETVTAHKPAEPAPAPQPRDLYRERGLDPDIDIASRTREVLDAAGDAAAEKLEGRLNKQLEEIEQKQRALQQQYDTNIAISAMEQARLVSKDLNGNTPDPETWKALVRKFSFHIQTNQWDAREFNAWTQAYELEKEEAKRVWRAAPAILADPAATPGAPPMGNTRSASQGNAVVPRRTLDARAQKHFDELATRFKIVDKEGLLRDMEEDGLL